MGRADSAPLPRPGNHPTSSVTISEGCAALRYLGLCLLTFALLLAERPASAQTSVTQPGVTQPIPTQPAVTGAIEGQSVRDHIVLRGKRLPLPPGEWTRLSQGFGRVQGEWPGAYGTIEAVLLAQITDRRIEALALLQTNALPVEGGWGIPEACASAIFTTGTRTSARNIACAFAETLPVGCPALTSLPAWNAGMAEAARRGLTLPATLAFAVARVGDRRDVLEARYGFDPARFGAVGAAIPADGFQARWTKLMEGRLEAALLTPGAPVPALPALTPEAATGTSDEMPVWQLSLYKLATNRMMQTAISFGIGMILTADAATSTTLAAWQSITHSAVYYGNELAWEWPRQPARMEFVAEVRP